MNNPLTRFERQEPWQPARHGPLHEAAWQFLATASLCFGAWYLYWRWTSSVNFDALWFSVPLILAETAAYIGLILFVLNLWSARSPQPGTPPASFDEISEDPDAPARPLVVDVFFATYSEDPELVRLGVRDAKALRYPHPIDVRVHVLDDGKREAMAQMAREEGAIYQSRADNAGFKAGNLRNALENSSGDLVVICDADTRPFPEFLEETLGYFRDPKMAWVQTPQWFSDIPPGVPLTAWLQRRLGRMGGAVGAGLERMLGPVRLGEDPFGNDPQLFYDFILRRRNRVNAAFCCGAGSVHRRDAVMEGALRQWSAGIEAALRRDATELRRVTGERELAPGLQDAQRWQSALEAEFTPYKFHVSEDIYTSIALHSDTERGWKSVQHPTVLSRMLSPSDLLSWTIQRFKYAGGTLDILRTDNPLFRPGLTLGQRVMYGSTFYSYLSPLWNVVFILAPIIFMLTGIAPLNGYSLDFFLHIGPFLLLNEFAMLVGLWGVSVARGRAWYIAAFPLNLRALWTVLKKQKISFPVTPKDRQGGRFLHLVKWQIGLVIAIVVALIWGWSRFATGVEGYTLGGMIANTVWGGYNALSMLPIIRAAIWQPDPEFETVIVEGKPA